MTHPKNWMSQYSQKPQFMRNRKVMERDVEQEVRDTLSERNVDQESGVLRTQSGRFPYAIGTYIQTRIFIWCEV